MGGGPTEEDGNIEGLAIVELQLMIDFNVDDNLVSTKFSCCRFRSIIGSVDNDIKNRVL